MNGGGTGARLRIWEWLTAHPGRTCYEITRVVYRRGGPTSSAVGGCDTTLRRMERDGQATSRMEYRPGQGRVVRLWYAVPGAFPRRREDEAR